MHGDDVAGHPTSPTAAGQWSQAHRRSPTGLKIRLHLAPEPRDVQVRVARRRHIADAPQRTEATVAGNWSSPAADDARTHEPKVREDHAMSPSLIYVEVLLIMKGMSV
ncbi:hypothetical protein [Micromonospora sp. NPDC047074]|uniref:hypothetical protein n=1 Tax=Micromonospora sp. NPDC047074 TaxID=3154339 RepID=UPI0034113E1F